jgi:hypothetical protein
LQQIYFCQIYFLLVKMAIFSGSKVNDEIVNRQARLIGSKSESLSLETTRK